jgi:hypothetical protein
MNTRKPFVLTSRIEQILKAIYFYRYMSTLDVTVLFYSVASLPYVRKLLSKLAGGADSKTNQYLYRFQLPHTKSGNTEKVYTLGSRGLDWAREAGLSVDWFFRPQKVKYLSYGQIIHNLTLTHFCVAATVWAAKQPHFRLIETRTCYEIARAGAAVVPDAWLLFETLKEGTHEHYFPVLLEIDRGMEYQQKFKRHVQARIEYIKKGGMYSKLFGHEAVIIAYVTTGGLAEYREKRRRVMCDWTRQVLTGLGKEKWASVFRFASIVPEELYSSPIFDKPVWYRPDSDVSIPIFAP